MNQSVLRQYVRFAQSTRGAVERKPDTRQFRLMVLYRWLLSREVPSPEAVAKIVMDFGPFVPDIL